MSLVSSVRQKKNEGIAQNSKLIFVTPAGLLRNFILQISSDASRGSRTPFERVQRITTDPLETECLYLIAKGENKALRLIPFLKVMPSPSTEQNACYFFSRREKNGLRFVSYHFETEAEVIEQFLDTAMTLDSIERPSD